MRLFVIIWTSLIILISCKKKDQLTDPELNTDQAIFTIDGFFRGVPFSFKAGDDDYYMFTDYYLNSISKFILSSTIKKSTCNLQDCPSSLRINLHGYNLDSAVQNFDVNQMFYNGKQFSFYFDSVQSGQNQDTNVVEIEFIDPMGIKYSTANSSQNTGYFSISSVQDYENNILGQKTKLVGYDFFCYVSDTNFTALDTITASGYFSFAYPSP